MMRSRQDPKQNLQFSAHRPRNHAWYSSNAKPRNPTFTCHSANAKSPIKRISISLLPDPLRAKLFPPHHSDAQARSRQTLRHRKSSTMTIKHRAALGRIWHARTGSPANSRLLVRRSLPAWRLRTSIREDPGASAGLALAWLEPWLARFRRKMKEEEIPLFWRKKHPQEPREEPI